MVSTAWEYVIALGYISLSFWKEKCCDSLILFKIVFLHSEIFLEKQKMSLFHEKRIIWISYCSKSDMRGARGLWIRIYVNIAWINYYPDKGFLFMNPLQNK